MVHTLKGQYEVINPRGFKCDYLETFNLPLNTASKAQLASFYINNKHSIMCLAGQLILCHNRGYSRSRYEQCKIYCYLITFTIEIILAFFPKQKLFALVITWLQMTFLHQLERYNIDPSIIRCT
jgi:hypothetical protein